MASGFKYDAQGFLVGEIVENGRDMLRLTQQSQAVLKDLRTDMKAVARAIGVQVSTNVRMSRPAPMARVPSGAQRTLGGNVISGSRPMVVTTSARSAPSMRSGSARASMPVMVAQARAANGRFVAGQGKSPALPGGGESGGAGAGGGRIFGKMSDTLGKLAQSLQATSNVDPALDAAKEIRDVVSPLGRGLFSLFGKTEQRKKERWYQRILKALTPGGEKKSQPGASGGGFLGGMFGGGGSGGGLRGMLGAAGGGAAAGVLGTLMKGGKGLMRRLPFVGALMAAGSAAWSVFREDDPTKTPDENLAGRYRGVGSAGGMLAGGFAGARLGAIAGGAIGSIIPGAGTAVGAAVGAFLGGIGGAMLGDRFGAEVGVWVKSLVDYDLPGKALIAWNSFTADLSKTWAGISEKAGAWIDSAKQGISTTLQPIREAGSAIAKKLDGITDGGLSNDLKATGKMLVTAWDATKGAVEGALAPLVPSSLKTAVAAGPEIAKRMAAERAPAGGSLGDVIAKGEGDYGSFNRGVAGDAKGAQMDFSKMTVEEIMAAQALPPGDAKRLFAVGKYQITTNPMKEAAKALGLKGDEKFTPELQERIFSEFLVGKKRPQIEGYIKGDHDNLASAQLAGAKEFASIANPSTGKSYYAGIAGNAASLSAGAFGGTLTGARDRYKALVAGGVDSKSAYAAVVSGPGLPSAASANIPSVVPPTIPAATSPDERMTQISSGAGAGRGSINVTLPESIGQNVSDRGVAHIVTGGLGGGATGGW